MKHLIEKKHFERWLRMEGFSLQEFEEKIDSERKNIINEFLLFMAQTSLILDISLYYSEDLILEFI